MALTALVGKIDTLGDRYTVAYASQLRERQRDPRSARMNSAIRGPLESAQSGNPAKTAVLSVTCWA